MGAFISDTIEIAAGRDEVWRILTDFRAYREWNPFIIDGEGEAREGARLKVRMKPPGRRGATFRPTVREAIPGERLRWLGHLFVTGLFDGEHAFVLDAVEDRTLLTQSERFSGLLVPLFKGAVDATEEGFRAMNRALKERAERR